MDSLVHGEGHGIAEIEGRIIARAGPFHADPALEDGIAMQGKKGRANTPIPHDVEVRRRGVRLAGYFQNAVEVRLRGVLAGQVVMGGAVAEIAACVQLEETQVIMLDVVKQRVAQNAEIGLGSHAKLATAVHRVKIVPDIDIRAIFLPARRPGSAPPGD